MKKIIQKELISHINLSNKMLDLIGDIEIISQYSIETIRNGGKIILFGNGGSAADAQHIAAELVGRFRVERDALPALALTTDTSAITSIGNDYGYDLIFSRQLDAIINKNDIVIGISTSGNSKNVINGLKLSKSKSVKTIGLSGCTGGEMNQVCDFNFVVPSCDTARIQEMHIFVGHTLCHLIDQSI